MEHPPISFINRDEYDEKHPTSPEYEPLTPALIFEQLEHQKVPVHSHELTVQSQMQDLVLHVTSSVQGALNDASETIKACIVSGVQTIPSIPLIASTKELVYDNLAHRVDSIRSIAALQIQHDLKQIIHEANLLDDEMDVIEDAWENLLQQIQDYAKRQFRLIVDTLLLYISHVPILIKYIRERLEWVETTIATYIARELRPTLIIN